MNRVMLVIGTRPEAIKMMPLYHALSKAGYSPYVCLTNQHSTLLKEVLDLFGVEPDCQLHIMKSDQSLAYINAQVLEKITPVYDSVKPDCVMVHGDTTTAMAAAMAAFYQKLPIVHIEAGLRTYDNTQPFPEEVNRKIIAQIADYHCAPTVDAVGNLFAERVKKETIFYVGNTVVDALCMIEEKIMSGEVIVSQEIEKVVAAATLNKQRLMLFTLHRRESLGKPMDVLFKGLKNFLQDNPDIFVVYPTHPNPAIESAIKKVGLDQVQNLYVSPALLYKDLVHVLYNVELVATDSGGLQEEAISLGKKTLVLREKTERVEGVNEGFCKLVKTSQKLFEKALNEHFSQVVAFKKTKKYHPFYGDGNAAERIIYNLQQLDILLKPTVSQNIIYKNLFLQKGAA